MNFYNNAHTNPILVFKCIAQSWIMTSSCYDHADLQEAENYRRLLLGEVEVVSQPHATECRGGLESDEGSRRRAVC